MPLLEWLLVIGLAFTWFGLLGGSALAVQRRPHYWIRVLVQCVWMIAAVLVLFGALELKLLPEHVLMLCWLVLVVSALVVAPLSCYRSADSPPGSSEGGGGGGTGVPPPAPTRPTGGIPLLDAEQSPNRLRDHTRPKPRHPGPRRGAGDPARTPTPF